jgi:hypothetical protein
MAPNVEVCGAASAAFDEGGRLPPRPSTPPGYVSLELIPGDVQRPMKDAKDIDVSIVLDDVCNSVVPVEQHAHLVQ